MTTLPQTSPMRLPRPNPSHLAIPSAAGQPMAAAAHPIAAGLTGQDVWRVIRANLWLIIGLMVVAAVSGFFLNRWLAANYPKYTSTVFVAVKLPSQLPVVGGDTNSIGTPDEPGGVDNLILINEGSMLTEVAKKTGGAFTWGTAQIAALLPSIAEDVSDYYSIAYRVTPQRDGVPRQVTVKTRNRTYDVRTRREVVERTDDARMNDRVAAAVFGVVPGSGLEVTAEAGDVKKEKNDSVLPLKVRIAIGSLSLVPQDGKHAGAFSIYVVSANERGELSEVTHQTRTFDVPPDDIERAATGYFTYELDMRVNDSADRVAVGVLDEVSKVYGLTSVPIVR